MRFLINIDKRVILFFLLSPIIIDFLFPSLRNNELIQLFWLLLILLWYMSAGFILMEKDFIDTFILNTFFKIGICFLILNSIFQSIFILDLNNFFAYSNIAISILGAIFYLGVIYFITNKLIRLESQIGVKSDGVITFILILALPVGIWWIQPRMQKIWKAKIPSPMDIINENN